MTDSTKPETVRVGFNQQQRQLLDRLRSEQAFANRSDGEIVRAGFVTWLKDNRHLSEK